MGILKLNMVGIQMLNGKPNYNLNGIHINPVFVHSDFGSPQYMNSLFDFYYFAHIQCSDPHCTFLAQEEIRKTFSTETPLKNHLMILNINFKTIFILNVSFQIFVLNSPP